MQQYTRKQSKCQVLEYWDINDGSGNDADNWSYSVKRPGFLSWNGNLAISSHEIDETTGEALLFTDSLIIWTGQNGNYLSTGDSAIDDESSKVLDRHRDTVNLLLEKAKNLWDI